MKKLFFLLWCATPLLLQAQKPKKVTTYYHKKLKQSEGMMVDGKKEGVWYYWDIKGYLSSTVHYLNDQRHGAYLGHDYPAPHRFFNIQIDSCYRKALKVQQNSLNHSYGLVHESYFDQGKLSGPYRLYNNGYLSRDAYYVNDSLHGVQTEYHYQSKQVHEVYHYRHGKKHGPYKKYDPNGLLTADGAYYEDLKHGTWTHVDINGHRIINYEHGLEHGLMQIYDLRDSLIRSHHFRNGTLHGPYFNRNLNEKTFGHYDNGQQSGLKRVFYKDKLYLETWMQNGKEHGFYRMYDTTGKVTVTGFHKEGKNDSTWTFVNEYGSCITVYKNGNLVTENCVNKKGEKEKTIFTDKNGHTITTRWYDNKRKKSEEVYGRIYNIDQAWDEKGKLVCRDTLWKPAMILWNDETPTTDSIYEGTREAPHFKGGRQALQEYINNYLHYPQVSIEMGEEGKVFAELTIGSDGEIKHADIKRNFTKSLEHPLSKFFKQMPAWEPGKRKGRTESSKVLLEIKYVLTDEMRPWPIRKD